MAVEWAWLPNQPRIADVGEDITLSGGNKGYILLFHGLTGSPAELAYVARHLHHRGGYTIRCPRLVNHGQPLGVLARTSWRELEEGARDSFRQASAEASAAGLPLYVGGLSLGAILALLLAAEFPDDVRGAACLAPTLFYDGWSVPWTHRLIPLAAYTPIKYFSYFREDSPYGLKDEVLRQKVAEHFGKVAVRDSEQGGSMGYAHFPVRSFCEIRHLFAKCISRLGKVVCPVLLVQAVHDDITSPRNSEFIYRNIASRQKEIVLLENSYHLVTVDLEREKVATEIARFLGSVQP
jgi:carboxylesterase